MSRQSSVRRVIAAILRRWPRWQGVAVVGVLATFFSIVMSEILTLRYEAFQTFAWDMGIFNQSFYTTVSGQGFFYYTADLPSGNGGHLFVAHLSPVLVALLPVYAALPSPPTLLVLQSVAIGFTAIPLYYFARKELQSERWAVVFAAACLACPALLGILWYDFHAEAFLPLGVAATVAFYRLGRSRAFLIAWFLTLAVIETAAPLLLLFGAVTVGAVCMSVRGSYRTRLRQVPWAVWAALLGAVAWLGASAFLGPYLLGVAGSSGAYSSTYAVNFQILGAESIPGVIPTALLHPSAAYAALSFDWVHKATYVLLLFGSLGFLPLAGRLRYLLPGVLWPVLAAFSNYSAYYSFGDQYAAYALPFLMLAAIDGFARIRNWCRASRSAEPELVTARGHAGCAARYGGPRARRVVYCASVVVLAVGVAGTNLLINPINPHPIENIQIPHGIPTVTPHDRFLQQLVNMIPSQASVLTSQGLFPQLSSRRDAYVLPVSSYFGAPRTFLGVLGTYVNESDYLLYDSTTDAYSASIFQCCVDFNGFGVLAEGEGAVLYERGWTGAPKEWIPTDLTLPGGSLAVAPARAAGPVGPYSNVLNYSGGFPVGTELSEGPFSQLTPGTYRVTFTVRVGGPSSGAGLQVTFGAQPIVVSITPVEVSSAGQDYSVIVSYSSQTTPLAAENVSVNTGSGLTNVTVVQSWPTPARLNLLATVLNSSDSISLYQVSITQVSSA